MITHIEDKNLFGKTINTVFTNLLRYDLNEDDCVLRYELRYRNPNRESVAIPDTTISSGEWKVPETVLNTWTGSNFYLAQQMCETFDFTILRHENG
jgi:hypothetical protein